MEQNATCPRCGSRLSADALAGSCPRCLLRAGFESQTRSSPWSSRTPPPSAAELNQRLPHLEVLDLLGQGGMGAVYKARQRELDRLVALKVLSPGTEDEETFRERFVREARTLAKLHHPNIVVVYDFGHRDGLYYLVMELVEGANLRQTVQHGRLKPKEALAIVPKICEALQYAHDKGVVHRDIKPENILLDSSGQVKIADFGLAKLLGARSDGTLTAPQQVMGTPHYMAPEQIERPLEVDHRADIYALGVVLYELLTGELPMGHFPPPSQKVEVDVRVDRVVLRTLHKEPQLRYQKVSELQTDIESLSSRDRKRGRRSSGRLSKRERWLERRERRRERRERRYEAFERSRAGREYKSKTTVWGLPLVHIATGVDPVTGQPRLALGIIAIGGYAVGGLAIGGMACGVVTIAGLGIGVVGLGGMMAALLLAVGPMALAPFSVGILSIGAIAVGVKAVGLYALGGEKSRSLFAAETSSVLRWFFVGVLLTLVWVSALGVAIVSKARRQWHRQKGLALDPWSLEDQP